MDDPRPRSTDKYSDSFMLHTVAPRFDNCKHQATNKSSKMLRMKTIDKIRYDNLQKLVSDAGGLSALVEKAKKNNKKLSRPTLDQILKKRQTANESTKNVGDELARKIEDALKLDTGWLDNPREMVVVSSKPSGINAGVLSELIVLIDKMDEGMQQLLLGSARSLLDAAPPIRVKDVRNDPE